MELFDASEGSEERLFFDFSPFDDDDFFEPDEDDDDEDEERDCE